MADFTLLHLSDVHFGMPDTAAEEPIITGSLIKAVHNAGIPPDLCIFSGDLAQAGQEDRLWHGMAWLDEVLRPFSSCPLALVPGNHDLDRIRCENRELRAAGQNGKSYEDWRSDLGDPTRFQFFIKHCSVGQTTIKRRCLFDWAASRYSAFHQEIFQGLTVNLIGLNTALTSADNGDHGRLVADLRDLNTHLGKTDSSQELTLVIGHHPLEWLAPWNQEEIRTALSSQNQGAHVFLCGHRHEPESASNANSRGQSLTILAAGAAYHSTKWARHFAFYRFNLERSRIHPTVYGYNETAKCWDLQPGLSKELVASLPERPATGTTVTPVAATPFDEVIRENIREVLADDEQAVLAGLLRKEAERAGISLAGGDLADLLSAPAQALDQAIAWLTLIACERLKGLRSRSRDDIPTFRERMREVLGWLLLRAVDPAWIKTNQAALRQAAGARVQVCLRRPSCIEVVVARAEEREAGLRTAVDGACRMGKHAIHLGGEGGFDPPFTLQEVRKAIWQVVVRRPVPKTFGPDELRELQQDLAADALVRRRYHLTVPLADPRAALTDADLDQLQKDLPELRLILVRVPGGESALLLDEDRLDRLIENFFEMVIEEKSTP